MPRYINKERLVTAIEMAQAALQDCYPKAHLRDVDILPIIDSIPSVEVDPVAHGQWIEDEYGYCHCDQCKFEMEDRELTTRYCPNCGARMEYEEEKEVISDP